MKLRKYKGLILFLGLNLFNLILTKIEDGSGVDEYDDETDEINELEKPLILTRESFIKVIGLPETGTFVMFHAPWCGHCKRMTSTWDMLAQKHNSKNKFLIAKVDCTSQTELCSDRDVLAYPTFMFFKKNTPNGFIYEGKRDLESMEDYLINQLFEDFSKGHDLNNDINELKEDSTPQVPVNILTAQNFNEFISKGFHFIKFYAPWCGHCKRLEPIWEELGNKYINTNVRISKVDCTQNGEICQNNNVRGYPTLIFFYNGEQVESYMEERSINSFSNFINKMLQKYDKVVESYKEKQVSKINSENLEKPGEVIELTEANFETARDQPGILFVKFFAPWCSHCKAMEGTWNEFAKTLAEKKNARIARVDCTQSERVCRGQGVQAYPTLYLYKDGSKMAEYLDARDVEGLTNFIKIYLGHDEL